MIQRVAGGRELTQGAIHDLEATLSDVIARGMRGLYLDAEKVVSFDSNALESLLELDADVRSRGLHFAVVNPSEVFAIALRITGLDQRLTVKVDEAATHTEVDGKTVEVVAAAAAALEATVPTDGERLEEGESAAEGPGGPEEVA